MRLLVVNAGSTSIKTAVFDADLTQIAAVDAVEIGGAARLTGDVSRAAPLSDHAAALSAILDALAECGLPPEGFAAAGHRVVHGGEALTRPTLVAAEVRAAIADQIPLAPLHNPVNLAGIDALARRLPELPQVACFDTAFHAGQQRVATAYAVAPDIAAMGIRRYGFHGLSYAGLVQAIDPLPPRLLACHLGGGASLCAIRDGRSVDTTMGYSPLSGLPMASRTGDIDGNAVLRLAEEMGLDAAAEALNRRSGLKGLGGTSDMRALLADPGPDAQFAVAHYCYWAIRHAGAMIAVLGGLDAIAFTGGIGENAAPIRTAILDGLAWAGEVPIHIVAADEERQIARETLAVLRG
ncbi:acetate kinase [Rhodobacteraceae bacterium CCMM004]|nr:acetate kinase [Rhodobacteraceae bacterium CCMM004]